jgi:hypothetical protein
MLAAAGPVQEKERGKGTIRCRTDTGQIARHCILLRFVHGVQAKITHKALLRNGRANKG